MDLQLSQTRASGVFLVRQNYYSIAAFIVTSDRERLCHNSLRGRRQQPLSLRRHYTRAQIQLIFFTVTCIIHAAAKSQRRRPVCHIHLRALSKHDWPRSGRSGCARLCAFGCAVHATADRRTLWSKVSAETEICRVIASV